MKSRFNKLIILLLFPLFIFFSCKKDNSNNNNSSNSNSCLIGTWVCKIYDSGSGTTITLTYIFNSGNTYSYSNNPTYQPQTGNWTLTNNTVILDGDNSMPLTLNCTKNTLTDSFKDVFNKQ